MKDTIINVDEHGVSWGEVFVKVDNYCVIHHKGQVVEVVTSVEIKFDET